MSTGFVILCQCLRIGPLLELLVLKMSRSEQSLQAIDRSVFVLFGQSVAIRGKPLLLEHHIRIISMVLMKGRFIHLLCREKHREMIKIDCKLWGII